MKRSASLALVIQSLRPLSDVAVAVVCGARRQRERVAARPGLRQRIGADGARRQPRQVAPLDLVAAPAQQRVDDERVLHVDEDADRRVDARQLLDGEHRVEERAAGAAVALGDLDAHDAELEQLVDERRAGSSRARPSRGRAAGPAPVGELADAVAEDRFVFGQDGQRLCVSCGILGHGGLLERSREGQSSMLSLGFEAARSNRLPEAGV